MKYQGSNLTISEGQEWRNRHTHIYSYGAMYVRCADITHIKVSPSFRFGFSGRRVVDLLQSKMQQYYSFLSTMNIIKRPSWWLAGLLASVTYRTMFVVSGEKALGSSGIHLLSQAHGRLCMVLVIGTRRHGSSSQ